METFTPKYRRDPNAKVESLSYRMDSFGQMRTRMIKQSPTEDCLEATDIYTPGGLDRGQSGMVGTIILGGMETTLDEMEDLLEAWKEKQKEKTFVPRRNGGEIAEMCRILADKRNEAIKYYKKNPSEAPKPRPMKSPLYLPARVRWVDTSEPGLQLAMTEDRYAATVGR